MTHQNSISERKRHKQIQWLQQHSRNRVCSKSVSSRYSRDCWNKPWLASKRNATQCPEEASQVLKLSLMAFTSLDYRLETEYQPGGALMVIGQPWSARATTSTDDSGLGRWVEATVIGKAKWQVNNRMCISSDQEWDIKKRSIHGFHPTMALTKTGRQRSRSVQDV